MKGLDSLKIPNNFKTNFEKLYNSQELFNIIGFKIETISIEKGRLKKGILSFRNTRDELFKDIKK